MSYHLFLDDVRVPADVVWLKLPDVEWAIVRNYDKFVEHIQNNGIPSTVAFDRDLAWEHYMENDDATVVQNLRAKDGEDCMKWLINVCAERNVPFPKTYIHTMNFIGLERMRGFLKDFGRQYPSLCEHIKEHI